MHRLYTGNLHNCNPEKIRDPSAIERFVVELCALIRMERLITGHFDETRANAAFIDPFSCKYFNPWLVGDFAAAFFDASDYDLWLIPRY